MILDWENERYVRTWLRDTVAWKLLSFEAKGAYLMIRRKVDRAGVLDVGGAELDGVAVTTDIPADVVARVVPELLGRAFIAEHPLGYVIPAFVESEDATSSDAVRAKNSREKRAALKRLDPVLAVEIVTKSITPVTPRDARDGRRSKSSLLPSSLPPSLPREEEEGERDSTSVSRSPDPARLTAPAGEKTEEAIREAVAKGTDYQHSLREWDNTDILQKLRREGASDARIDAARARWIRKNPVMVGASPKRKRGKRRDAEPNAADYLVPLELA